MTAYEMFTKKGDAAVGSMLAGVAPLAATKPRSEVVKALNEGMAKVAKKFPEVNDTAVREAIAYALDPAFDKSGLKPLSIFEF